MNGRLKGNEERSIMNGFYSEMMARQKSLKPLAHYLKPEPQKKTGAQSVLALFKRWAERNKQDGE